MAPVMAQQSATATVIAAAETLDAFARLGTALASAEARP